MIKISDTISIDEDEIEIKFIRSTGPGGQHVNKVESAVQIRFDAKQCGTINEAIFVRLKKLSGQRMTADGVVIITANSTRSQIRNKEEAIERLAELIKKASIVPKNRKKTKPSFASKTRRLEGKKRKGNLKKLRGKNISE
ncbi:MAG: aminoacyl-tRNA hydrolase [Kordiimonadaceae bacterium]|jgi:ribosome-associated protein|nr:aminoacyl-tRNA hydrolase [Kordiimonadaceae bacterium]MBT6037553.1 aminoacyl-tRNA hydrolase [Kordiimonadaceae bacterium]MBT7583365.1 aminoacyl-tRNA hydrolase [Kordiimonadaceae bacterium]